jgi:hypothetical protein
VATIDVTGKWNLRYKGIKLNGTVYPIIEMYINMGYAINVGDRLSWGYGNDFANDLIIRYQALGSGLHMLACCGEYNSPLILSSVYPSIITKSITDGNYTLKQTVSENISYGLTDVYNYLTYNGQSFSLSSNGVSRSCWSIPMIVVKDEYQDKYICFDPGNYGSAYNNFPATYTGAIDPIANYIRPLNGFATCTILPATSGLHNLEYATVTLIIDGGSVPVKPIYPDTPDSDPYKPNAEPGGGDGETQTPDSITDPALPTISSVDTGFITLYKPSISQLNDLATWMWGDLDVDSFKRVMQSPMDAILGLSILPGIVPSGSSSRVKIGNLNSGVSMSKVSNQYVKFDCGTVTIKRKWGAFLDYSPYTKTYLYLPFIGIRLVETDSIMNTPVQVKYNIDVMSGACCAFVIANGTTLYSFIGQCACSVPVTGRDWTNLINGVLGAVSGVASAVGSVAHGNIIGAVSGIASAASSALSAKPTIEHSGSMGGMGGLMGIKRPYFIIERPAQAVPGHQNEVIGYPSFTYKHVGDLSGYNEFEQIHLEGLPCTSDELNEIENILLTGVII